MEHTPLDGPDGGSRDGAESVEDDATSGGLGEIVGRVRDALGRVGSALALLFGAPTDPPGESLADRRDAKDEPDRRLERSIALGDGDRAAERPVLRDGGDDRPVPASGERAGPRDRPELVARWQDDRLTLSEPDEAGAQISSDTWAEVDP